MVAPDPFPGLVAAAAPPEALMMRVRCDHPEFHRSDGSARWVPPTMLNRLTTGAEELELRRWQDRVRAHMADCATGTR